MNLRNLANTVSRRVNPNTFAQWFAYSGYTVLDSGKTQPAYAAPVALEIQAQAITAADLQHIEAMNLSQVDRVILASAPIKGVDREAQTGGDLLVFDSATWLVTGLLEEWTAGGWCRATLTKQNGG